MTEASGHPPFQWLVERKKKHTSPIKLHNRWSCEEIGKRQTEAIKKANLRIFKIVNLQAADEVKISLTFFVESMSKEQQKGKEAEEAGT